MEKFKKKIVSLLKQLQTKNEINLDVQRCRISPEKSEESAQKYYLIGNQMYTSSRSTDDFLKLYECYAQSIAHAPANSREMALAYANLSAVLLKLQKHSECLEAIECCFSSNYPEKMKFKIYLRKIKCLKIIDESLKAKDAFDEASAWIEKNQTEDKEKVKMKNKLNDYYEKQVEIKKGFTKDDRETIWSKFFSIETPNLKIPTISSSIDLKYSESWGRHYIATRDIQPGEVLMKSPTFALACTKESQYQCCWECNRFLRNCIPCDCCKNVIFCTVECKERAWNEYHNVECKMLSYLWDKAADGSDARAVMVLAFRILFLAIKEYGTITNLRNALRHFERSTDPHSKEFTVGQFGSNKYLTFLSLISHDVSYDAFRIAADITYKIATETTLLGKKYDSGWTELDENEDFLLAACLLVRHVNILTANSFQSGKYFDTITSSGAGISITGSFFNHNCYSNAFVMLAKHFSVAFAQLPIKKGEQVCINYLPSIAHENQHSKQRMLGFTYDFTCKCTACMNNWPTPLNYPNILALSDDLIVLSTIMKIRQIGEDLQVMDIKRVLDSQASCKNIPKQLSEILKMLIAHYPQPLKEVAVVQFLLTEFYSKLFYN